LYAFVRVRFICSSGRFHVTDETDRPTPEGLGTEAEFALALKELKAWSGLSYRELEARARAAGLRLPFSTASGMLGRSTLPREDLLIAFTTACGLNENEVAAWVAARKRLAITAITANATVDVVADALAADPGASVAADATAASPAADVVPDVTPGAAVDGVAADVVAARLAADAVDGVAADGVEGEGAVAEHVRARPRIMPRSWLRRRMALAACALLVAAGAFATHGRMADDVDVTTVDVSGGAVVDGSGGAAG
jgi:hypothetical protein